MAEKKYEESETDEGGYLEEKNDLNMSRLSSRMLNMSDQENISSLSEDEEEERKAQAGTRSVDSPGSPRKLRPRYPVGGGSDDEKPESSHTTPKGTRIDQGRYVVRDGSQEKPRIRKNLRIPKAPTYDDSNSEEDEKKPQQPVISSRSRKVSRPRYYDSDSEEEVMKMKSKSSSRSRKGSRKPVLRKSRPRYTSEENMSPSSSRQVSRHSRSRYNTRSSDSDDEDDYHLLSRKKRQAAAKKQQSEKTTRHLHQHIRKLKEQITYLKEQSNGHDEALRATSEYYEKEISRAKADIRHHRSRNKKLSHELSDRTHALDKLSQSHSSLQQKLSSLTGLEKESKLANSELKQASFAQEELQTKNQSLTSQLASLRSQNDKLHRDLALRDSEVSALQKSERQLNQKLAATENESRRLQSEQRAKAQKEIHAQKQVLESERGKLRREMQGVRESTAHEHAASIAQTTALERENGRMQDQIAIMQADLKDIATQYQSLKEKHKQLLDEAEGALRGQGEAEVRVEELTTELKMMRDDNEAMERSGEMMRQQLEVLKEHSAKLINELKMAEVGARNAEVQWNHQMQMKEQEISQLRAKINYMQIQVQRVQQQQLMMPSSSVDMGMMNSMNMRGAGGSSYGGVPTTARSLNRSLEMLSQERVELEKPVVVKSTYRSSRPETLSYVQHDRSEGRPEAGMARGRRKEQREQRENRDKNRSSPRGDDRARIRQKNLGSSSISSLFGSSSSSSQQQQQQQEVEEEPYEYERERQKERHKYERGLQRGGGGRSERTEDLLKNLGQEDSNRRSHHLMSISDQTNASYLSYKKSMNASHVTPPKRSPRRGHHHHHGQSQQVISPRKLISQNQQVSSSPEQVKSSVKISRGGDGVVSIGDGSREDDRELKTSAIPYQTEESLEKLIALTGNLETELMSLGMKKTQLEGEYQKINSSRPATIVKIKRKNEIEKALKEIQVRQSEVRLQLRNVGALT